MTRKRMIALYAIYLIAITAFFLYTAFPKDAVRRAVNAVGPRLSEHVEVSVQDVAPSIPPGVALTNLRLAYDGTVLLQVDRLKMTPDYLSWLVGGRGLQLKGTTSDGVVDGEITGIGGDGGTVVDIQWDALDLARIPAVTALVPERRVEGRVSGQWHLTAGRDGFEGKGEIAITEASVGLLLPLGDINAVPLSDVAIAATADATAITVTSCRWQSPLGNGTLDGSIRFQEPAVDSAITMNGTVAPSPVLIRQLGAPLAAKLFPASKRRKNGYQIAFSGTVEKPLFDIR